MAQPSGSQSQLLADGEAEGESSSLVQAWEMGARGKEGGRTKRRRVSREKRENDTGRGSLVRLTSWLVRLVSLIGVDV